jgi:hypothetical protein
MRYLIILAALILPASASTTLNLDLTSEEGGAKTRLSWSYTGTPTMVPVNNGLTMIRGLGFSSGNFSSPPYWSVSGTAGKAFTASLSTLTGLSTGLTLTNTTTDQSYDLTQIEFFLDSSEAGIVFTWPDAISSLLNINLGEVLELSGPTSGSILADIAFSNFNDGTWTLDQLVYDNFDPVLTVGGAAIPEPTSALMCALGATMLLRRRR